MAFPPSVPLTFFCAWRPRCASQFWFLQHLSCENACFAYACCKCVAGAQVFHLQHAFGTGRKRVFEFEWYTTYDLNAFLAHAILQRNVSAAQATATLFFRLRRLCWHKNELPALEVSRTSILLFPPSLPLTLFCCSRPRCRSQFWFSQPL